MTITEEAERLLRKLDRQGSIHTTFTTRDYETAVKLSAQKTWIPMVKITPSPRSGHVRIVKI